MEFGGLSDGEKDDPLRPMEAVRQMEFANEGSTGDLTDVTGEDVPFATSVDRMDGAPPPEPGGAAREYLRPVDPETPADAAVHAGSAAMAGVEQQVGDAAEPLPGRPLALSKKVLASEEPAHDDEIVGRIPKSQQPLEPATEPVPDSAQVKQDPPAEVEAPVEHQELSEEIPTAEEILDQCDRTLSRSSSARRVMVHGVLTSEGGIEVNMEEPSNSEAVNDMLLTLVANTMAAIKEDADISLEDVLAADVSLEEVLAADVAIDSLALSDEERAIGQPIAHTVLRRAIVPSDSIGGMEISEVYSGSGEQIFTMATVTLDMPDGGTEHVMLVKEEDHDTSATYNVIDEATTRVDEECRGVFGNESDIYSIINGRFWDENDLYERVSSVVYAAMDAGINVPQGLPEKIIESALRVKARGWPELTPDVMARVKRFLDSLDLREQ